MKTPERDINCTVCLLTRKIQTADWDFKRILQLRTRSSVLIKTSVDLLGSCRKQSVFARAFFFLFIIHTFTNFSTFPNPFPFWTFFPIHLSYSTKKSMKATAELTPSQLAQLISVLPLNAQASTKAAINASSACGKSTTPCKTLDPSKFTRSCQSRTPHRDEFMYVPWKLMAAFGEISLTHSFF